MQAWGGKLITSPWRRHDTPTSLVSNLNRQPWNKFWTQNIEQKVKKRKEEKEKRKMRERREKEEEEEEEEEEESEN